MTVSAIMTKDNAARTATLHSQPTGLSRARSQKGMALLSVLLVLMIMSGLAAAMTASGRTELVVASNTVSAAQAAAAAEAGLNHAAELARPFAQNFTANGFAGISAAMTGLVQGPDGLTGTVNTDADNGSLENLGIPRPPAQSALGAVFGVTYEARVYDDDDPARGVTLTAADIARIGEDGDPTTDTNSTMVIQAIGYAPDNTTVTYEATIANSGANLPALSVGGDLTISGNPTFTGSLGGLKSNGDLDISGNPNISGDATSAGSYSESGNPTIGGVSGGGYGTTPLPAVAAIDHKPNADFILNSTGQMTDQVGTVICDASADNAACETMGYGWVYNPPGWNIGGNSTTDGTYYVEGPAHISGNVGSAADPAEMTIIAEGSIELSGNSDIEPHTPELLFVTDGDLKINGSVDAGYVEGAVLVHEQISIGGTATLAGQIIVEDAVNNSTLVSQNTISGNATFSFNGTFGAGGTSVLTLSAWREVR